MNNYIKNLILFILIIFLLLKNNENCKIIQTFYVNKNKNKKKYIGYKFKNYNIIFILTPKNASSNIKKYIMEMDKYDKNTSIWDYKFKNVTEKEILGKYKNNPVIFFCRNPYDRFVSGYSKITYKLILKLRFDLSKTQEECNKIVKNGNINVNEWWNIIKNIEKKNLEDHFCLQTMNKENIFKHKNLIILDVKKLNNLNKVVNKLLNTNFNFKINGKFKEQQQNLNNKLKNEIYEYYHQDFKLLNYKK